MRKRPPMIAPMLVPTGGDGDVLAFKDFKHANVGQAFGPPPDKARLSPLCEESPLLKVLLSLMHRLRW